MSEPLPVMQFDPADIRNGWRYFGFAAALTLPALMLRFNVFGTALVIETLLFGLGILGAAFLLSWGAEVAQLDISQALAIAFLAFIAVLPEYAVDLVFAWKAGHQDRLIDGFEGKIPADMFSGPASQVMACGDTPCRELAIANMTGANRLLIGIGWATVVLVWYFRSKNKQVMLNPGRKMDLGFLLLATLWAFTIPLRGHISLIDLAVLGVLFIAYLWHAALEESEHPELVGPPVALASLSQRARRTGTVILFLFAAGVILASAEPFADGLVHVGEEFGINKFLLVQWLAPLASEAPEMIIAVLFVLRARPDAGLGTLVSSKVNQWTLLVGTIPLVYAIARGSFSAMTLDHRQVEEVFLTAAQSLFAVAVLANLTISRGEAAVLLVLFLAQFGFESTTIRIGFAIAYMVLTVVVVASRRENFHGLRAAAMAAFTKPGRVKS